MRHYAANIGNCYANLCVDLSVRCYDYASARMGWTGH